MPLEPGERVGPYQILGRIGAGGMGEVYKAHDARLNRHVAIKCIRAGSSSSDDGRARFLREARAASELNHPNIVTIHDVVSQNEEDFIVMEHVEGEPLHRRVGKNGMPPAEALDVAIQIAAALAAAHERGIIHRDLKPANILVSASGVVKVLDFGLAKRVTRAAIAGANAASDATRTAALEQPLTKPHTILGTVPYMSPEQAQGRELDSRSDIFSFGSVLYEMLTGRQPFAADSELATLAAILQSEPPRVRELASHVPRHIERVVARCMKKDPSRRYQHMADLKVVLEDCREALDTSHAAARVEHRSSWPMIVAAATMAAAATGAAFWYLEPGRQPATSLSNATFTQVTADSGLSAFPALSPDGKLLAYASDRAGSLDIWVQQVAGTQPVRVTFDASDEYDPSFSPDGSTIVYRSERKGVGGIYTVPALGGEPKRVTREGRRPRFSFDGKYIAYWTGESHGSSKTFIIPAAGGEARQIAPEFFVAQFSAWSPDGNRVLFFGLRRSQDTYSEFASWTANIRTGEIVKVSPKFLGVTQWFPDGRLLLMVQQGENTNLASARFDRTGRNVVNVTPLTAGSANEVDPSGAGPHVAFAAINSRINVWALPIDADTAKVTGELSRLTDGEGGHIRPSISSDGNLLAFSRTIGLSGIFRKNLVTGKETLISAVPYPRQATAEISPDGRAIVYSIGEDPDTLFLANADGDNDKLCEGCRLPTSWLPDTGEILFEQRRNQALVLLNTRTRKQTDVVRDPKLGVSSGKFSPDGHWIAFHSLTSTNTRRIFVARRDGAQFPIPPSEWIPITDGRSMDRYPSWSPNGNILYFLSERDGDRCIYAQRLQPGLKTLNGEAFAVKHFHSPKLSLTAVGDPVFVRLATATNKLVFSLAESTGNIWLRTEQQPER